MMGKISSIEEGSCLCDNKKKDPDLFSGFFL